MFVKTFVLIMGVYIFLGYSANLMFNQFQFGMVDPQFALLRSCIVFMNGFMLNEQKVILSSESLQTLERNNGFLLTFIQMIVSNILIRQIIINIVAITMHDEYHNAKFYHAEKAVKDAEIRKEATNVKVKERMARNLLKEVQ